jgi:hypothetical protein
LLPPLNKWGVLSGVWPDCTPELAGGQVIAKAIFPALSSCGASPSQKEGRHPPLCSPGYDLWPSKCLEFEGGVSPPLRILAVSLGHAYTVAFSVASIASSRSSDACRKAGLSCWVNTVLLLASQERDSLLPSVATKKQVQYPRELAGLRTQVRLRMHKADLRLHSGP